MTRDGGSVGERTATLRADVGGVFQAILAHPFLAGLTDGSLAEDRFAHYVAQDAHYLHDYARALAALAGRASDPDSAGLLASHAANAISVERTLHTDLLGQLGAATALQTPPSPTTVAYTSFLLATVHSGSFAEGLAAVLPCYWIYWQVGVALQATGSPHPSYDRWIGTYGGDDFAAIARPVIELTEQTAVAVSPPTWARMRACHHTGARFEWMFWDAAWRREGWPV